MLILPPHFDTMSIRHPFLLLGVLQMNIPRMEYFLAVAELLSFSKAAEQLHISHQALSKQIQLLENELGARLLERDKTKVRLTEIGRKALELYKPLSLSMKQCELSLNAFVRHKKTYIRLGYFNDLPYRSAIDPIVQHIYKAIPDAEIEIIAADAAEAKRFLMEDWVDLLICVMHEGDEWPDAEHLPLLTLPESILVSEHHPWYQKTEITKEDIKDGCLVCYESFFSTKKHFYMQELDVKERVFVRNSSTYMGVLAQGKAFGVISELHNRSEDLYKFFPLPPEYSAQMQLTASFKPLHPRADVFKTLNQVIFPFQTQSV